MILGLSAIGEGFDTFSTPFDSVTNIEIENCMVDNLHARDVDTYEFGNTDSTWTNDTVMLAKFNGTLKASNESYTFDVDRFILSRKRPNESTDVNLAVFNLDKLKEAKYIDYTATNGDYIYSVTAVDRYDKFAPPTQANINVLYHSWYVVDPKTNTVIPFDRNLGENPTYSTSLNMGRTEIQTLSKYPTVFYNDVEYLTMSLETTMCSESDRDADTMYFNLLEMCRNHTPVVVKGANGTRMVCELSNLRKNMLQNHWQENNYFTIQVDCTEVMDFEDFITPDTSGVIAAKIENRVMDGSWRTYFRYAKDVNNGKFMLIGLVGEALDTVYNPNIRGYKKLEYLKDTVDNKYYRVEFLDEALSTTDVVVSNPNTDVIKLKDMKTNKMLTLELYGRTLTTRE